MTSKTRFLEPNDPDFYNRPAEKIARDLPGSTLKTEAGDYTIIVAEGFSGLPRKGMVEDYQRMTRNAGEICITNFRGWPQINIVGEDTSGKEQLTWIKAVESDENHPELTSTGITQAIADIRKSKKKALAFALEVLDGKNVRQTSGPLRIVQGKEEVLHGRNRVFIPHPDGTAKNSVGYGMLSAFDVNMPQSELKRLIKTEAEKHGLTYEDILDPEKFAEVLQKSPRLARIVAQLENRKA